MTSVELLADQFEIPEEVKELLGSVDPEASEDTEDLITLGVVCSIWNIVNDRIRKARPHLYRNNRPRNSTACEEIRQIADGILRSWEVPTPEDFMAQATVGAAEVEADNVVILWPYGKVVTAAVDNL